MREEPVRLKVALDGMISRPRLQTTSVGWRPVFPKIGWSDERIGSILLSAGWNNHLAQTLSLVM
jgi:hypothetical protein